MLGDISPVMQFAERSGMNPVEVVECFQDTFWKEITPGEYNRLLILLIEKAVDTCEGIMRKNLSIRLWISVFSCLPAFGSFPKILSAIVSGIQEGSCRTAV